MQTTQQKNQPTPFIVVWLKKTGFVLATFKKKAGAIHLGCETLPSKSHLQDYRQVQAWESQRGGFSP